MAEIKKIQKVRLFTGIMFKETEAYNKACQILTDEFGEANAESKEFEFNFTDYYTDEMGIELKKRFLVFGMINPERLSEIKIITNKIETLLSVNGKRAVNIDPGFIGNKQVVLASAKASPYRIYLKDGIYGQIVLVFGKHGCIELPHAFADFKQKEVREFLVKNAPVV